MMSDKNRSTQQASLLSTREHVLVVHIHVITVFTQWRLAGDGISAPSRTISRVLRG
jgi:hypothetical protein